jgi:hypothetical protein
MHSVNCPLAQSYVTDVIPPSPFCATLFGSAGPPQEKVKDATASFPRPPQPTGTAIQLLPGGLRDGEVTPLKWEHSAEV